MLTLILLFKHLSYRPIGLLMIYISVVLKHLPSPPVAEVFNARAFPYLLF